MTPRASLSSLTPHGAKATLLAYLARYGASPPLPRLILGHHSVMQYGALETYSPRPAVWTFESATTDDRKCESRDVSP